MDDKLERLEARMVRHESLLADVRVDVAFMRGKMEGRSDIVKILIGNGVITAMAMGVLGLLLSGVRF